MPKLLSLKLWIIQTNKLICLFLMSTPLSSTPLSSTSLPFTPLSSTQLCSTPLSSTQLCSTPLSSYLFSLHLPNFEYTRISCLESLHPKGPQKRFKIFMKAKRVYKEHDCIMLVITACFSQKVLYIYYNFQGFAAPNG